MGIVNRSIFLILLLNISLIVSQSQSKMSVTIFAAASLTDAFESIAETYETLNPSVDLVFNFAGSSTLAAQLAQDAPADIFASANPMQMRVVHDAGRIDLPSRPFAYNQLIVILPIDNPANITQLADLTRSDTNLVIAAPDVPVRVYTDTVLHQLALADELPDDFAEQVLSNVVSEEGNVRRVVAKIALGEADAGIVYTSDVTPDIRDQLITIPIPDAFNVKATYPIALLNDAQHPQEAGDFLNFVLSDTGQMLLAEWGFIPVSADAANSICVPISRTADSRGFLSLFFVFICDTPNSTG